MSRFRILVALVAFFAVTNPVGGAIS